MLSLAVFPPLVFKMLKAFCDDAPACPLFSTQVDVNAKQATVVCHCRSRSTLCQCLACCESELLIAMGVSKRKTEKMRRS